MADKKSFTKVEAIWFHHGGFILGPGGINEKLTKKGWRLVDVDTLNEILQDHQRFLHRKDGYLIATAPESIEVNNPNDKDSDLIVYCVKSNNEEGLVRCKLSIRFGILMDHSDTYVLVVK